VSEGLDTPAAPDGRAPTPPFLRGARAAMTFLTRIPVGGFPYCEADFRWASAWFPLVGLLLGAAQAVVFTATSRAGSFAAAALTVGFGMLLTGAFHEDGLADTADALGGAYERERLFEILKDSRVGSFGAGALAVVLVLRIALLARLGVAAPLALVLTQSLSRTPPIWMMVALPYVTSDAAAKSRLVTRAGAAQALVATAWPALAIAVAVAQRWLSLPEAAAMLACIAAVALLCAQRFHARAGGITGDFLGATQQVGECAALLALALTRGEGP
jgi:adenosylcobinamide-GDP ribazoletransferase